MHSRAGASPCPAYRNCRELKGPSPMLDNDYEQQITTLRGLLQPIKETAMKLTQSIGSDVKERRQQSPVSRERYHYLEQDERNDQQRDAGSGLITVNTSISVCALCGVALHLKDLLEESRHFTYSRNERNGNYKRDRDVTSKDFDNVVFKMAPYKASVLVDTEKNSNDIFAHENAINCPPLKGDGNYMIDKSAKKKRKTISKIRSVDTIEEEFKSKLLFVKRNPSDKTDCQICQKECQRKCNNDIPIMERTNYDCCTFETVSNASCRHNANDSIKSAKLRHQNPKIGYVPSIISYIQDASTLTHEMFCPCACGLLVKDGTESEISIEASSTMKEKLVKTKNEELGSYRYPKEASMKVKSDRRKVKKTKTQMLKKSKSIEHWIKEEVMQLQLQAQAEELQRNIQIFKEENEYLRYLVEKCHCPSGKTQILLQLLPIRAIYSGLVTVIELLQAKCRSKNGIRATLTHMLRGTINVQRITEGLLAPFIEH